MEFILLSKEQTKRYCEKIRMPAEAIMILTDVAEKTNTDKKLYQIYEDFYAGYIESGYWTTVWEPLKIHPYVEEIFGKHASLFYLHAALERLPLTIQKYSELGIGDDIFSETLSDMAAIVQKGYKETGYYCIKPFSWIWRHLEARIFRLGRLQFLARPMEGDIKGFYNPVEDIIVLFCGSGIELRANGDMQGVCGKEKTADGFVTKYRETAEYYIGNPVTPYGKGIKTQLCLDRTRWQKVLDEGDYILEVHIPADGDFSMQAVKDSYRQAREFYAKHFPELCPKGMVSHTWMFSPQLQEMLPPVSKIVGFQRLFYLYPTKGSLSFLWSFVFNENTEVKDAKPDTLLRRRILEYIDEDREIFDMKGVFLDAGGELGHPTYMDKYDEGKYSFIHLGS